MTKDEVLDRLEEVLGEYVDNLEGVSVMPDRTVRVATRNGNIVQYEWFSIIDRARAT